MYVHVTLFKAACVRVYTTSGASPPENLLTASSLPAQEVESVSEWLDWAGACTLCSSDGVEVRCAALH